MYMYQKIEDRPGREGFARSAFPADDNDLVVGAQGKQATPCLFCHLEYVRR